ncbi:hypothetical protein [Brevibacillus brevis]|uniref:hypothetical protein n=1 Tax=Brevibacillus brevis TaxID=1393 RepID=UPI001C8D245E|nr:hypothetical protein [Brevibacillus brevis]MBY0083737.1 hypothetical protein [Brevibacillus brevis]
MTQSAALTGGAFICIAEGRNASARISGNTLRFLAIRRTLSHTSRRRRSVQVLARGYANMPLSDAVRTARTGREPEA